MLNQAVLEAMYSVPYVETYLDIIENLPDELQRYLSQMRELDVAYQAYMKEIETLADQHATANEKLKKRNLLKAQVALIAAQEIGDEKLAIMQQIQDIMEGKTRQIDGIFENLPSFKEVKKEETLETKPEEVTSDKPSASTSTKDESAAATSTPPPKKRARRKPAVDTDDNVESTSSKTLVPRSSATIAIPKRNNNNNATASNTATANSATKKKKRRSKQQKEQDELANASQDDDLNIDPNEPTYCLCNQISFGQMVMCDNDLCPIQWFHFSCVGVTVNPKGKWYCPNCRKSKSNVVRPKKELVERLEKYNKEKQEKK